MKLSTYIQPILLFCIFMIITLGSCQNAENNDTTNQSDSLSTHIREISADFTAYIEVETEVSEDEIMLALANKYPKTGAKKDCDCEEKECFKQSILGNHYFKEDGTNKALSIIGNSCEGSHATLGWCDVAIFEEKEGKWSLKSFFEKAGGGSAFGQSGNLGNIFPIAKKGLGIEIGFSDMAQGQSFEGVNILMYRNGEISDVANIQTHFDNYGDALEEADKICQCQSYSFMPEDNNDIFSLRLVIKDCDNSNDAADCSGEMRGQTTIEYYNGKYETVRNGIF